ncbi:MAG TPA: hypothetical protein VN947_23565 [Polyangia bacterium]|nr:hypothetical protein [Polyangia bacterium]
MKLATLQTGAAFGQSADIKHATHCPVGALQRGVVESWATHCGSSPAPSHARQRPTKQIGATSLHSADEPQIMSGPTPPPSPPLPPPPSGMTHEWCMTSQWT